MAQFKRLIRGIQAGDSKKILPNMAPSFKGSDGEMVKNTRLETVLKVALVEGSDGLANGLNFDEVSAAKKVNSSLKHRAKDVQIFTKVAVASIENQDFNYAPS